jgi:hypothetical protein
MWSGMECPAVHPCQNRESDVHTPYTRLPHPSFHRPRRAAEEGAERAAPKAGALSAVAEPDTDRLAPNLKDDRAAVACTCPDRSCRLLFPN